MFHWKPCAKIHYPKDCPPDAVYLFSAGRIGWQGSGNGWHVQCNKRWVDHPKQSAQWTLWNLLGIEFAFESIEIYWNLLESIGIYWNLLEFILESIGFWKGQESVEIYWKCRSRGSGLYWMDGQIWPKPPAALTNCDPGFYKDPDSRQLSYAIR